MSRFSRVAPPAGHHHIAIVVHEGMDHGRFVRTLADLARKGQRQVYVLGKRLGSVMCDNGQRVEVDASLRRWPGSFFDLVYVMQAPHADADEASGGELMEEVFLSAAACAGALIVDVSAPRMSTRPMPVFARRPARLMPRLAALARLLAPSLVLGGVWTAVNAHGLALSAGLEPP